MLTYPITFPDLSGNQTTRTLHFHLTRTKLLENMTLKDRYQRVHDEIFAGGRRELTSAEVELILKLIKELMELAYGERDPNDDASWDQSPEVFSRFRNNLAYDAFLMWLFEDATRADTFMAELMPDVEAQETVATPAMPQDRKPKKGQRREAPSPDMSSRKVVDIPLPEDKEASEPLNQEAVRILTRAEMLEMPSEEFQRLKEQGVELRLLD